MAVTAQGTGTKTADGTEQTLLDVAIAGSFILLVDKINMAAGDTTELRIYQIVLTGGTRHSAYFTRYVDAPIADDQVAISVPVSNELTDSGSIRFTLKQTTGTNRNYDWKVLKIG